MERISDDLLLSFIGAEAGADDHGLYIDAGVSHIRIRSCDAAGNESGDMLVANDRDLREVFAESGLLDRLRAREGTGVYVTGKLAAMVRRALGVGHVFSPAGALWLAARDLVAGEAAAVRALAMIEISASGYTLVGVDRQGRLHNDLLLQNPRCGAGTGVNIDRVLQKLGIAREEVDTVLAAYLGEAGRARRQQVTVRADRCGVFSSSATISDKNQGIPLAAALATTMKSEVLKTCRKLPEGFDKVVFTGRFFRWAYVRDCAEDYLRGRGVTAFAYDSENTLALEALRRLVSTPGAGHLIAPEPGLIDERPQEYYPGFAALKAEHEAAFRYRREPAPATPAVDAGTLAATPVFLGLDVGSTMAKVVMSDESGRALHIGTYSNSGDTIETVKHIFQDFAGRGLKALQVRAIGITGSARYQVQEALARIYPALRSRIQVLVENYAHARGSIAEARRHVQWLKDQGVAGVNEDFCVLIDIGGEDTKISTIALKEAELFSNAMNVKCSAGTGSLMDTLSALFGLPGAAAAGATAFAAPRALAINATCAVFLVENAQKLQAAGVPRDEILASANWAIVENMARTLWSQVELPPRAVVLLHGQTMLSDPLPLAVTHRLQAGQPAYALVPQWPGHRACFGLIHTLAQSAPAGHAEMTFATFVGAGFEKRIIQCKGAACDDSAAVCNRTSLKCKGSDGGHFSFTLGGCSAINELFARAGARKHGGSGEKRQPRDTYKELWDFVAARQPRSDDPDRLVIARSFCVSEWSYFLARIFTGLAIPVHVDGVRESDLTLAQPLFNIDSCAPHMGAVGQYRRLAGEAHGIILAPQIERLPTGGKSAGRTCTLNQGGVEVARNLARVAHPGARFHAFNLDLGSLDAGAIADQLFDRLQPVFAHYGAAPTRATLEQAIAAALAAHRQLRAETAELAARLIDEARADGFPLALVVGREYILNPGIYDSHVRRLLRDKGMAAIPSWVLDVELDEQFGDIYWRNPHTILSILNAVAGKSLAARIRQPALAAAISAIEASGSLLPVVQISTFCCGPDSVTAHLVAEIMKQRPFLLIQSDAVIKELAHLENRVNTYVRQLELGLHDRLRVGDGEPFAVRLLDSLENDQPLDRQRDVIYFPTLSDNRVLSSTLRGAGFTCIDNYADGDDLTKRIKAGRKATGDAVCAPLAGVYADLIGAVDDFGRRQAAGDPQVAGKSRLLFFNNKGSGPCRQGQYVQVHKLLVTRGQAPAAHLPAVGEHDCGGVAGGALLRLAVAQEADGYNFGIEEWTQLRIFQGAILQGVMHDMLFAGGAACRDGVEFREFTGEYLAMKQEVFAALEAFAGPGRFARATLAATRRIPVLAEVVKTFAYRLHGRDLARPLARFAARWLDDNRMNAATAAPPLSIHISGEAYMRVAQAEDIFRTLLARLGFGRFRLHVAPLWSYLDYLVEEAADEAQEALARARAGQARQPNRAHAAQAAGAKRRAARFAGWRFMLRHLLARPLYRAARLPLPRPAAQLMRAAEEILPTRRPQGELSVYCGEALLARQDGADLFINVAPGGCMVSAMAEVLTPALLAAEGSAGCRFQHLFSSEGEVDGELLSLAVLKAVGPERFFRAGK